MRELLTELTRALDGGTDCVYCSVVETRGSTPQKAGAAMVVFPDGRQAGTLGGGCVEAEVKRQALRVLSGDDVQEKPNLLSFCLDDNYGWDDGLICGGRMNILADPITKRRDAVGRYYRRFYDLVDRGIGCTEAVAVGDNAGSPIGSRFLIDLQGNAIDRLGAETTPDPLLRNLVPLAKRPKPYLKEGFAYLPVLPRITLLIVGGGHVGQAVAKLAADVDFDIWVLDDRAQYANVERFPDAQRHLVGDIGEQLKTLAQSDLNPAVYILIVTRGHGHDEEALLHVANSEAGYIGMIGSKRKIKLIFEDLIAKGISREVLAKVHAPLGFSIGSQTVPEIAVSIVAELIACRNLGHTLPEARSWVRL